MARTTKRETAVNVTLLAISCVVLFHVARSYLEARERDAFEPVPMESAAWLELASVGHRTGSTEPSLVIVEFTDYECEACIALQPKLKRLKEEYGDVIQVRHRHYPNELIHPHATRAALASECAGEQGRFEQMHRLLYVSSHAMAAGDWALLAQQSGVDDAVDFDQCLNGARLQYRIAEDVSAARRHGVYGTPTLVIVGVTLTGDRPYGHIRRVVNAQLAARE